MLTPAAALRVVRLVHTAVWALLAGSFLGIPILAYDERWLAAAVLIALVLMECIVLDLNHMRWPPARHTNVCRDKLRHLSAPWLGRYNKLIVGASLAAGLLFTVSRWAG